MTILNCSSRRCSCTLRRARASSARSRRWQLNHENVDIDPMLILNEFVTPGFSCTPGSCGEYSTTNFVLLGLVLASLENVTRWEEIVAGRRMAKWHVQT